MSDRFLKLRQVREMTALSSATIYRMMATGEFPRQIKIGAASKNGAVVWSERDVLGWMRKTAHGSTMRALESCLRRGDKGQWPQEKRLLFVSF